MWNLSAAMEWNSKRAISDETNEQHRKRSRGEAATNLVFVSKIHFISRLNTLYLDCFINVSFQTSYSNQLADCRIHVKGFRYQCALWSASSMYANYIYLIVPNTWYTLYLRVVYTCGTYRRRWKWIRRGQYLTKPTNNRGKEVEERPPLTWYLCLKFISYLTLIPYIEIVS